MRKALIVGSASKFSCSIAAVLEDDGYEVIGVEWDPQFSNPECSGFHRQKLVESLESTYKARPIDIFVYSHFNSGATAWKALPDMLLNRITYLVGNIELFVSISPSEACKSTPFMPSTLNGSSGKVQKILVVGIAPVIDRPWVANPGPRKYWKMEDGQMVFKVEEATTPSLNRTPMDLHWAAGMVMSWCNQDFAYKAVNIEWDPPKIKVEKGF